MWSEEISESLRSVLCCSHLTRDNKDRVEAEEHTALLAAGWHRHGRSPLYSSMEETHASAQTLALNSMVLSDESIDMRKLIYSD